MSRILFALAFLLCAMGYTVEAAHAQQPHDPPTITDAIDDVLAKIRRVEAEQRAEAQDWAARRRLPLSTRRPGGRRVSLVGLSAGRPTYLTSYNRLAAQATRTERLHPGHGLGLHLTGAGLDIGIWDGGVPLQAHQELAGRVSLGNRVDADDHATHVAGTLAAAGVRPDAQGMAYEARLRAYDWDDDASEMTTEAAKGLLVSNHSYGVISGWYYGDLEDSGDQWYWVGDPSVSDTEDYAFGWYDVEAAQFDRVVFAHPHYLPVVAAGNDRGDDGPSSGPYRALNRQGTWQTYSVADRPRQRDGDVDGFDSISGAAVAKNVLTVGSIRVDGFDQPVASSFSSFGPTDDGRVKPDLVGYGERVLSALAGTPTQYGLSSGTSMAAPNVAGSLVLLQEHAQDLTGHSLRAASLKGLALHTARDAGLPGPDYRHGWGLLDAEAAANQITASLANDLALLETQLEDGAPYSASAAVEEDGPLRVTISWTDLPSSRRPVTRTSLDDPMPHLRNDLDLRLIHDATGATYLPFVLDPARPAEAAVSGDNVVDSIEQIYLPNVAAGDYTIVVSHKGTLVAGASQPFTLLVTGAARALRPVAVSHLEAVEETVDRVLLSWNTQFERSAGAFIVRRAPVTYYPDGSREYGTSAVVGTLEADGASERVLGYRFEEARVPSGRYLYRVFFEDAETQFLVGEVEANVPVPEGHAILSNYPNPFTDRTYVVLDLPSQQEVTLDVYDALGRRVARVYHGVLPAGRHELAVAARTWSPGVYFARLLTPEAIRTHQLVVMR